MESSLVQPHGTELQKRALALSAEPLNMKEQEEKRWSIPAFLWGETEAWGTIWRSQSWLEAVLAQNLNLLINSHASPCTFTPGYICHNSPLLHFILHGGGSMSIPVLLWKPTLQVWGLEKWLTLCTRLRYRRVFRNYTNILLCLAIILIARQYLCQLISWTFLRTRYSRYLRFKKSTLS